MGGPRTGTKSGYPGLLFESNSFEIIRNADQMCSQAKEIIHMMIVNEEISTVAIVMIVKIHVVV